MNDQNTKELVAAIRALLGALLQHPEDIRIMTHSAADGTLIQVRVNPEDEPLAIGAQGAHIRALQYLTHKTAEAAGGNAKLSLITKEAPRFRERRAAPVAERYNPAGAVDLLTQIIAGLNVGKFRASAKPGALAHGVLAFDFVVTFENPEDAKMIAGQNEPASGITIHSALATLFTGIGRKDGVVFTLQTPMAAART